MNECTDRANTCPIFSVDASEVDSLQVEKTDELRIIQIQYSDTACYVEYLEKGCLLRDERTARKIVLGSKQYEMSMPHHSACMSVLSSGIRSSRGRTWLAYFIADR